MPELKTKNLTYKRAEFHTKGPVVSELLRAALKKAARIQDRRESLAPPNETPIWRVIGQSKLEKDFCFGVLMRYAPGTSAQFVVDDATATALTVEQLAAPATSTGKKRELLESILYFAAVDNHLVLMQGGLRSKALEDHLQWLLHGTATLDGTNVLRLVDQPPLATRNKLAKLPVRGLNIGGSLDTAPIVVEDAVAPEKRASQSTTVVGSADAANPVMDAIRSLIGVDKAAKLNLDALAGSNIEYSLKIRYNRKTTEAGQKLLNTLGSALRHAEDVDAVVELQGGGKIEGSDLRMTGTVKIETFSGVPSTEAVFEVMRTWLVERVSAKDIEV